ncbi:prephenate dehydratase [Streptomyces coeruleoprunus]|uniref:Prephenate dehydratase n=1 Tax=Streptomyces coeruleoprunus TaxID=285563 RepID=A0ABV9XIJ2_9ACTN
MQVAYLGPAGSFTELAARKLVAPDEDLTPRASVPLALRHVRSGAVGAAVVPLENSVEGVVPTTVDGLVRGGPLRITGEALLRVTFALASAPGVARPSIRRVLTHPHAHSQCRDWLARELPEAEFVPAGSTSEAAATVAREADPETAAVCAPATAARYGLDVLATDIGARRNAVTRFVRVAGPDAVTPAPSDRDRTSIVLPLLDQVGALHRVLGAFARHGANLTAINSRPTGDALGRYCFFLECDGHIADTAVARAFEELRRHAPQALLLGSYPQAPSPVPSSTPVPALAHG